MKRTLMFFLALGLAAINTCLEAHDYHHDHHHHHEHAEKLSIYQKDYRFSRVFEMFAHGKLQGAAVKRSLRLDRFLRDDYDIYDADGIWQATAYGRIFCLGFFRPWGAEFDIYDQEDNRIGVIDGQVVTDRAAKFSIYNAKGDRVGIAYMDFANAGFLIVYPEKEKRLLVRMTRNFVLNAVDHWDIIIEEKDAIDPRILKAFAAFAVDKQGYFRADR